MAVPSEAWRDLEGPQLGPSALAWLTPAGLGRFSANTRTCPALSDGDPWPAEGQQPAPPGPPNSPSGRFEGPSRERVALISGKTEVPDAGIWAQVRALGFLPPCLAHPGMLSPPQFVIAKFHCNCQSHLPSFLVPLLASKLLLHPSLSISQALSLLGWPGSPEGAGGP